MAKLKSVCQVIVDGDWIESKNQSEGGIRLIQTGNIGVGEYLDKSERAKYITNETFERLKCTEVFPGDILISRLPDPIGRACIVPQNFGKAITAVDCTIVRLDSSLCDVNYFVNYTQSVKYYNELRSFLAGTTRTRISRKNLEKIEIPLPSLDEQRRIAAVLDKVSGLIAKRREQLDKLDELVKARFVEMFGDETEFDRWPSCTIGDVADICVGVVIKPTQYYADQGIPAFRSLNIGEMRVKDGDWVYFTKEGHQKNQKSVVRKNDVLVVRSGAPGTACVATEKYDGYNAVDIIIAHPDNTKVDSTFLAAFTNMPHGMNQIRGRTGGAAQQHFNVGGYKTLRLIMPPMDQQQKFASFVKQTDKSKLTIQQSLDKLEVLKKALMQQYFG